MKLVLANNQSSQFVEFYRDLQSRSTEPFDYAGYQDLLFSFDGGGDKQIDAWHTETGKRLADYDGVYINGYLAVYELAATVAICCDYLSIAYVNQELHNPPSLSKLSMHAKLAANGVRTPRSFGASKQALLKGKRHLEGLNWPAVLKRADADRGIDNFKVTDLKDMYKVLDPYENNSLWILQEYVPNEGYYLVSFYDQQPCFSIFRSLQERPDGDTKKAHFYKPPGGTNATLVPIADLPPAVVSTCQMSIDAMNRQIGSVDCLYDPSGNQAYVLEVNYNPQLVTIETYKDVRQRAFLDNLPNIKRKH